MRVHVFHEAVEVSFCHQNIAKGALSLSGPFCSMQAKSTNLNQTQGSNVLDTHVVRCRRSHVPIDQAYGFTLVEQQGGLEPPQVAGFPSVVEASNEHRVAECIGVLHDRFQSGQLVNSDVEGEVIASQALAFVSRGDVQGVLEFEDWVGIVGQGCDGHVIG